MTALRKTAIVAGVFFLITEVAAIAARALRAPAVGTTDYVLGAELTAGSFSRPCSR